MNDLTITDDRLTIECAAARAEVRVGFQIAAARLHETMTESDRLWAAVVSAGTIGEETAAVDAYLAHLRVVTS